MSMHSLVFRFLILCLMTCGAAGAQVQEAEMSAEGRGATRAKAILDALSNATAQAFGFTLQSSTRQSVASAEVFVDEAQSSALLEQFNKAVAKQVSTDKVRPVTGYQVNSADETANGRWVANVTIRYATYAKLGADSNRRTLIIASTSKQYPQAALEAVEQAVVASRRFDVLTRSHNAVFEQEKLFITGPDASRTEVARLAGASGADYVLIIDLQDLEVQNNIREVIRMSDEVIVSSKLSGTLRLRIMEFTTRKIKWVGTQAFAETLKGRTQITSDVLAKNLSAAARKLVSGMVETIFPIRVVRRDGNMLVLNRGEGSIDQGVQLSVFVLGEDLRDPQSGESLGRMETHVATGTVIEVKPKYSVLRLTSSLSVADNTELLVRSQLSKEAPPTPNRQRDAAAEGRERNRSLLTDY
jgi:hypothetical protein